MSTYQIKTLADIFNLPSIAHIERCLTEMRVAMIQARAANDLLAAAAKESGVVIPESGVIIIWPEVSEWNDDGKGKIEATYLAPDGSTIMETRATIKHGGGS